ncbi:MAG: magnesium/cobalt transporter CorA [Armatimonadetes bacterium]|nr:magnesium/cobalt transporter CorA [Armatimonadota bacterium]
MGSLKSRAEKAGAPPGTMAHIGERKLDEMRLTMTVYDAERLSETIVDLDAACAAPVEGRVTWLHVEGLHDVAAIQRLGESHGLHPLIIEDILDTSHRPKMEDHGEYIYVVARYFADGDGSVEARSEQISLILSRNMVITFCEGATDVVGPVRRRLQQGESRLRERGADYLAYAILDVVVDSYFVTMDHLDAHIEDLDAQLVGNPGRDVLHDINRAKRYTALIRRFSWPLRELMGRLERSDSPLIEERTRVFLSDVYDHTIQIVDMLDSRYETLSSMLDTYLSSVSNRMNEVMQVITVIATIFIPISFIAGIYGMNFDYMPERHVWWAYPATLGVMLLITVGMLIYFRRKRWI